MLGIVKYNYLYLHCHYLITQTKSNKMKTTVKQFEGLTEGQEKAIALKLHLGEEFFVIDGKIYEGTEDEAREQYSEQEQDENGYLPSDERFEPTFDEYCNDNFIEVEEYDTNDYNNDYLILTDEEADDKWEEELQNYIDECITPEIDKIAEGQSNLSYYIKFDEEMWKRDAKMDGRGHCLGRYDGNENEETVNGTTYYIYRQNKQPFAPVATLQRFFNN